MDEFAALASALPVRPETVREIEALTDREQQVLRLVARGMSNKAIGAKLFVGKLVYNIPGDYAQVTGYETSKELNLVEISDGVGPETFSFSPESVTTLVFRK